ncbi:hypothetical protein GCM10009104_13260 [Marinobacterium maritimum]|uniref:TRAP-type C4-dicarboxylate transport system, substrate-binding protein n=1 Tax=Marinobacterium maritimum TaxID=500162 RepID=A0ABN1I4U1_9GAMM
MIKSKLLQYLALALFSTSVVAETTLVGAEGVPNRGNRAQAIEYFTEVARELSGDELKFDIHWGGSLLDVKAVPNGVSRGTVDFGTGIAAYDPKKLIALSIGDIPYKSSDPWVGARAMYELMTTNADMQRLLEQENLIYLTGFASGGAQFECSGDSKIESVADIKGKKIRALATYSKVLSDLGAQLVPVTQPENYRALDIGLVDCSVSYLYTIRALKTYEVIDHVTLSNWGQISGYALLMNKDVWDGLTEQQRQALKQAGAESIDYFGKLQIDENNLVVEGLASGRFGRQVPVVPMSASERAVLVDASNKYIQDWIEDVNRLGVDGQAIWHEFLTIVGRLEAEKQQHGYPWQRQELAEKR